MRWSLIWLLVAFVVIAVFLMFSTPAQKPEPATPSGPVQGPPAESSRATPMPESPSTLADGLNAAAGTIETDLQIVDSVLEAFRTNFPGEGNPVGLNQEITAALAGRNRLGLQLIPRRHPAINHRGELVDRWGTPFFFHQLSGDVMEIQSAGPDREMHTADDVVFVP